MLGDLERARGIYALAVDQPSMDMPELLWKSWIDFEYEEEEYERTRELYERLLRRTSHVKVWVSFAQFEANAGTAEADALAGGGEDSDEETEGGEKEKTVVDEAAVELARSNGLALARKIFERGYADLKQKELKEEVGVVLPSILFTTAADLVPCDCDQRVVLLEAWKALESVQGDAASLAKVQAMLPRVVKKMRKVDGEGSMMEEYYDMLFADDETATGAASLKFFEAAHAFAAKRAAAAALAAASAPAHEDEDDDDEDDDEDDENDEEEGDGDGEGGLE